MDDTPLLELQRSAAAAAAAAAGPSKPAMTPAAPPSLRRKRLADISNLSSDRSAATSSSIISTGKENPVSIAAATSTKDAYIAQLLKENNALIRALGERNKVIELSAAEIKNVRCALQKLTQQNQQLVHANTLMLAERNQDKDKLKTLQHEVGCVQAALKAQNFELEEEKKLNRQLKARIGSEQVTLGGHSEMDFVMEDPAIPVAQNTSEQVTVAADEDARPELDLVMEDPPIPATQKKAPSTNRKRSTRSQSLSVTNHQDGAKEKDLSSRRLSRRRTTSLRNNLCEPNENLFEIEDINLSVVPQLIDDPMSRDSSSQAVPSAPSVSNVSTDSVTEERPNELIGTSSRVQIQKDPIGTSQVQIQKEPVTSKVQIKEPITSQVWIQKEPIGTSQVRIQKEPITSQVRIQKEPITSQVQIQKEPIKSQVQIQKEPIDTLQVQIQKESNGSSQVQIQKEPITSQVQIQEVRRLSVDRPSRRAKEKVCYKEIPLNVKMRREY